MTVSYTLETYENDGVVIGTLGQVSQSGTTQYWGSDSWSIKLSPAEDPNSPPDPGTVIGELVMIPTLVRPPGP